MTLRSASARTHQPTGKTPAAPWLVKTDTPGPDEGVRLALQSGQVGLWETDMASLSMRWSAVQEKQHGLGPGAFPGTIPAWLSLLQPNERQAVLRAIREATPARPDFRVEYQIRLQNGTLRWLACLGSVAHDASGVATRAAGVTLDISDRKQLEEAYAEEQRMAAVGRLASGVAHEFNNLLTAILGYADLVLASLPPGDGQRPDVLEIKKAGTNAADLSRQMLEFSRRRQAAPGIQNLNSIITGMAGLVRHTVGEHISVSLQLDPHLKPIKGDRGQLEQLIVNLAVNARDAMPGGGRLVFETGNAGRQDAQPPGIAPGDYVRLTVSDTGVGMSPEVQARIFDEFFTTKTAGDGGPGLGLSIVEGIVLKHGGHIAVTSAIGRGAAFTVHLPQSEAAVSDAAPARPARAVESGGCRTILLVEDNDQLRDIAHRSLEKCGYEVLCAPGSEEALQLVDRQRRPIDLLLTDVVMPEMNGVDLAQRLMDHFPALRVLYMSGYSDESLQRLGIVEGPLQLLQKPFTPADLALRVKEALAA